MKNKWYWIIGIIIVLIIIGYNTNWFGLKKTGQIVMSIDPATGRSACIQKHCCAEYDTYGNCKFYEDRACGRPCPGSKL